jgi:hypothetical protein
MRPSPLFALIVIAVSASCERRPRVVTLDEFHDHPAVQAAMARFEEFEEECRGKEVAPSLVEGCAEEKRRWAAVVGLCLSWAADGGSVLSHGGFDPAQYPKLSSSLETCAAAFGYSIQ